MSRAGTSFIVYRLSVSVCPLQAAGRFRRHISVRTEILVICVSSLESGIEILPCSLACTPCQKKQEPSGS